MGGDGCSGVVGNASTELFNVYRVSVLQDEKIPEICGTTM